MLLKLKVTIQVFSKQYLFIRIILILILGTLMQIENLAISLPLYEKDMSKISH